MIDIGCGDGMAIKNYSEKFDLDCYGVDGDWTRLPKTDQFILHDFSKGKIEFDPEDTSFDCSYSIEFLEHVEEKYQENLSELNDAIKKSNIVNAISITNPGLGYTIAPKVLISSPDIILDNITDLEGDETRGYSGLVTSITPITVGGDPSIQLSLLKTSSGALNELTDDTPIYVFNTRIGSGVTAMDTLGIHTVGIGTTFADNVYHLTNVDTTTFSAQNLAIVKCKVQVNTGLTSIGDNDNPVGEFSWGELRNASGFGRSSSISIGVTGLTIDAGLTTFPVIQRRGSIYGIRDTGALKKQL